MGYLIVCPEATGTYISILIMQVFTFVYLLDGSFCSIKNKKSWEPYLQMKKLINKKNVPRHDRFIFQNKNDFCVVIPVINEGDRIRNQIKKMNKYKKIDKLSDIIITR